MESNNFIISLNGLTVGKSTCSRNVGKEFFAEFDNEEVIDAQMLAEVEIEKSGHYVGVDCRLKGTVTVACDRCLADLKIPVDTLIKLSVKYGMESGEDTNEGEREVVCLPQDEAELDMSQIVYDYACLALPMQRVHAEGECDPQMLRHLGVGAAQKDAEELSGKNNPFSGLKGLFDINNN